MKLRFFLLIALFAASISCKNKKDVAAQQAQAEEAAALAEITMNEQKSASQDSLVISFEKTACFGHCPIYKVKIYESGFALYEGINFVEKMGMYYTYFDKSQIEEIYNTAVEMGYFKLNKEYNDPLVTDLPSTISEIQYDGKSHKIRARMNTPKKLKAFHDNLAITLLEKNWEPYDQR